MDECAVIQICQKPNVLDGRRLNPFQIWSNLNLLCLNFHQAEDRLLNGQHGFIFISAFTVSAFTLRFYVDKFFVYQGYRRETPIALWRGASVSGKIMTVCAIPAKLTHKKVFVCLCVAGRGRERSRESRWTKADLHNINRLCGELSEILTGADLPSFTSNYFLNWFNEPPPRNTHSHQRSLTTTGGGICSTRPVLKNSQHKPSMENKLLKKSTQFLFFREQTFIERARGTFLGGGA